MFNSHCTLSKFCRGSACSALLMMYLQIFPNMEVSDHTHRRNLCLNKTPLNAPSPYTLLVSYKIVGNKHCSMEKFGGQGVRYPFDMNINEQNYFACTV